MQRISLLFIITCLVAVVACSGPSDAERARKYRQAAVTVVTVENKGDEWVKNISSGVLLKSKNGIILTAADVIAKREDRMPILCYLDSGIDEAVNLQSKNLTEIIEKEENQCDLLETLEDLNIAVLQLVGNKERGEKGVEIAKGDLPEIGESVYSVHSHSELHGLYLKGYATNITKGPLELEDDRILDVSYLITFVASITRGSTGAMVMNEDDKLVGVLAAEIIDAPSVVFAIPMDLIYPKISRYIQ